MSGQEENFYELDEELIESDTTPAANIDNYQYYMFGAGVVLLFYFFTRHNKLRLNV
jgi:hypothetical protein